MKKTACVLLVLALLSACATSPTGRRQLMLVSEKDAIAASRQQYLQTMGKLSSEGKLVTDQKILKRVDTITGRLISQAIIMRPATGSWEWSVQVIDDPKTVNAWCMAGGRMAIYTGLIQKIDPTDDELAQVMGHEISHALADHTRERMSVAYGTGIGAQVLSIAIGAGDAGAQLMQQAALYAIQLPNSRESESEADQIGIELAARAGFDPAAAVTLWNKMGKLGGTPAEFMSTHPSPEHRAARLRELGVKMQPLYDSARANPVVAPRVVNAAGTAR